ncbi:MAG: hypothetical protein A2X78_01075 [Gammaproteobacteria bacterium GWE2_37_16]|nr:MAG: hypothetical protein A2X78_01075 [Gammaproteobacteria bacterium GWE2_37_16]
MLGFLLTHLPSPTLVCARLDWAILFLPFQGVLKVVFNNHGDERVKSVSNCKIIVKELLSAPYFNAFKLLNLTPLKVTP